MQTQIDPTPYYQRLFYNLVSLSLIMALLYMGQGILVPLFFSILMASVLLPAVSYLERKGVYRFIAILLMLVASFIFIVAVSYFLTDQMVNFFDDLPLIQRRLNNLEYTIHVWVRSTFSITIHTQNKYIDDSFSRLSASGTGAFGAMATITEVLSYIVLLPVYTFLLLYYRTMIKLFLIRSFQRVASSEVLDMIQASQDVSQKYIAGLMIDMVIVFGLNASGFLLLGIKYALFLALVAAILNLVPYLGMLVANIFCMLITLISGDTMMISQVVWVGLILGAVQVIDNNFLTPLVIGAKVRINSLATIIGVLVGGYLCGAPGMFLSIPGMAVIKVIADRVPGLNALGMLLGDERMSTRPVKTNAQP
jgi:predicted PurR-regulated permease PerM